VSMIKYVQHTQHRVNPGVSSCSCGYIHCSSCARDVCTFCEERARAGVKRGWKVDDLSGEGLL